MQYQKRLIDSEDGLIREYFSKIEDMTACLNDYITTCIEKLNKRPRKCLGWKTPYELFFGKALRLI